MKTLVMTGSFLALFAAATLVAQETPEFPKPQKEHEWLHQLVGEWESESKASFAGQEFGCKGTVKASMLGGFWVISEIKTDMMGSEMTGLQTIGYDAAKKTYVGSWVDTMTDHQWIYRGSVDATGKILTLEADGPNMLSPGKTAKFRDVYEFKSKDEMAMTSQMQGEDGQWTTFMSGTARRKK
jgi:hypothetical protein